MVEGSNVTHQIVWGEDCRQRRHFDCISFINYVLSQTTIPNWSADIGLYTTTTPSVALGDPIVPGDLLFRNRDHIGILDSDGQVLQAEDSINGVHGHDRYNPAHWTGRGRLPDSLLPNAPIYN